MTGKASSGSLKNFPHEIAHYRSISFHYFVKAVTNLFNDLSYFKKCKGISGQQEMQ